MSSSTHRGAVRSVVALAAAVTMFMVVGVASAAAAISLTPGSVDTTVFPAPVEIAVTGTGLEEYEGKEKDVRVGVCEMPPIEGVPPCGAFASNVVINGSGELSATIEVEDSTIVNAHDGVTKNQPPTFTCGESNCIVLVSYHPGAGEPTILGSKGLPFLP